MDFHELSPSALSQLTRINLKLQALDGGMVIERLGDNPAHF
jgi:hypothetical protein